MSISNYTPVIVTSDSPVPLIPSLLSYPTLPTLPSITTFSTIPPIITTTNPLISFPLHPSLDLNRDSKLHEMMTKYFYYKTLDKWLKKEKDMLDLLNYLRVTDRGVELVNNLNEYKSNVDNDNQQSIDKKVAFIEKNILSKDDVYHILKKYVKETSTNWYDLEEKGTYFIKEIIKNFIKKKLISAIEEKMRGSK